MSEKDDDSFDNDIKIRFDNAFKMRNKEFDHELRRINIELEGLEKFYHLREQWSTLVVRFLTAQVLFQFSFVIYVLKYPTDIINQNTFIISVTIQTLSQFVTLAAIIISFLFKTPQKNKEKKKVN